MFVFCFIFIILFVFVSFSCRSVLEYLPRSREQFGLIECTAKNAIGIQQEPCRYLVAPAAGPFFPYNCLVSNQSDSTLSIRCDSSVELGNTSTSDMQRSQTEHVTGGTAIGVSLSGGRNGDYSEQHGSSGESVDDANDPLASRKFHYHRKSASSKAVLSGMKSSHFPVGAADTSLHPNLTTAAIYALYFSPEVSNPDEQSTEFDSGKLTYRNGGQSVQRQSKQLTVKQLSASASSLLMDLVPKFNSHSLNLDEHLFVYPPTYYICEIYTFSTPTSRPILIKNLTIDAIARRIMNPLNGSFSFLIDQLPPNTPLKVNIYAQNDHKRAANILELDAKTLRAAERRIDSASQEVGHARGRKSSFFEELYGGYGRLRSKHLIVGLLIGSVAVIVFVAVILIVMASIKSGSRHERSSISGTNNGSGHGTCGNDQVPGDIALDDTGSKRKAFTQTYSRNGSIVLGTTTVKESSFIQAGREDAKCALQSANYPSSQMYNEYNQTAFSLLDAEEDVNSMRSDHQLLSSHAHQQVPNKFYTNVLRPTQSGAIQAPPSYYELEQSIASSLTDSPAPPSAYVNLISSNEAKPDLIPNSAGTLYPSSTAGQGVTLDGHIFDTVTFDARANKPNTSTMLVTDTATLQGEFLLPLLLLSFSTFFPFIL